MFIFIRMKIKWNKTTLIIIFWLLFFVVDFLKKIGSFADYQRVLFYYFPGYLLWVALTIPLSKLFDYSEKFELWKQGLLLAVSAIVTGSIKVIANWLIYFAGLYLSLGRVPSGGFSKFMSYMTLFYFMEAIIIAAVLLTVFFIVELYHKYKEESLRSAQLENQLAMAQLQTLKMQLQPHFLFNANNTISMLVRKGENAKAVEMIAGLSDLLRSSLERENHQLISLQEELDLLKQYLQIETLRFEDRLSYDFDIEAETLLAFVPSFLLQPLLENAFKHGIAKSIGKAVVTISARKKQDKLRIHLFNSGPHFEEASPSTGIGLSNTIKRLQQLYQTNYQFELSNHKNGVLVKIVLPFTVKDDRS